MPAPSVRNGFWKSPHSRALPCVFAERTLLMGIVNATPDSFSDGGEAFSPDAARSRAAALVSAGADIIDLGAESTRPGFAPVGAEEELRRLLPALAAIREALPDVPVSVDTYRPEVAEAAIAAGADIINDVRAIGAAGESGAEGRAMARVAARLGCPLIAMHNRAFPRGADFLRDFLEDMRAGAARLLSEGVPASQLWLDPGFGFGKTPEQNLRLVAEIGKIAELGFPVLLAASRKSTLGLVLGGKPPRERAGGDAACCALGAFGGAACLRLHDVGAHRDCVRTADAIFRASRAAFSAP
ncbi:MAG TPA: dihydropteroate synthase [Candidatus Spyradosoma merdigallinarum]|uniref:Dihydropteroate synthase n=1 Tax=Candidatus Spyradosoma merdigallinarum TaxID=2840950 RepID=A0A9D1NIF5_9BACT|nr:dihydropteroate synthase [Candidatus Spyradosoma merdigallinarum]